MHPMMVMTVAREVERERQRDRHTVQLRSLALANRAHGFDGSHAASGFARRLLAGISLRLRLSYRLPCDPGTEEARIRDEVFDAGVP
jgi:hypothetical protein